MEHIGHKIYDFSYCYLYIRDSTKIDYLLPKKINDIIYIKTHKLILFYVKNIFSSTQNI